MKQLLGLFAVACVLMLGVAWLNTGCGGSSCGLISWPYSPMPVANGESASHSASECSTACHSKINATWNKANAGSGTVALTYYGSCGVSSVTQSIMAQGSTGEISVEGLGIKNLCGENQQITWYATLTNNSGAELQDVTIDIFCPQPAK